MADGFVTDLTTVKWKSAKAGYAEVELNKTNNGGPLMVDGKTYTKGIGTHAESLIVYDLLANVARFSAKVAIDDGGMKALGIYDADKVKLVAMALLPDMTGEPAMPPVAEIAALTGDATRGKAAVGICYTCHRIGAHVVRIIHRSF